MVEKNTTEEVVIAELESLYLYRYGYHAEWHNKNAKNWMLFFFSEYSMIMDHLSETLEISELDSLKLIHKHFPTRCELLQAFLIQALKAHNLELEVKIQETNLELLKFEADGVPAEKLLPYRNYIEKLEKKLKTSKGCKNALRLVVRGLRTPL